MLKWIETTGKNEEDAIQRALAQLNLDRDEVSVEVLERAKSGFLGIGSTPAKVKVSYEAPDEVPAPAPVAAAPVQEKPAPKKSPAAAPAPAARKTEAPVAAPVTAAPAGDDEKARQINDFLIGLLERMEVTATPKIAVTPEGNYKVELLGEGLGALIGRRGETLDAIQQLTSYSVNKGQPKRVRIHVDAENYRAKREESLQHLAHKVAGKVIKYRRNVTLEPMNAYERHVIHTALQDVPDISTYSTGTEPNRRTVVAYARGEHRS
mgnify:CR=1 FL=1